MQVEFVMSAEMAQQLFSLSEEMPTRFGKHVQTILNNMQQRQLPPATDNKEAPEPAP